MNIKQDVEGEGNIVAGRNVVINALEISQKYSDIYEKVLKPAFEDIDSKITNLFPEGLISSSTHEASQSFSSEKLFLSLTYLGLPIEGALHVISKAEAELSKLSQAQKKLSTDDIRSAVANTLYQYDSSKYSGKRRQFWGDKYIRTYGMPSNPLLVINTDGSYDELDYKFLRDKLLPHLMEVIWGIEKFDRLRTIVSRDDLTEMAEEILRVVKSLGIYRIHYLNLLELTKELALQPPHPWFVERAFDYQAIRYDFDKAEGHCRGMLQSFDTGNYDACLYSYRETLHHSCSALLAYYGIFMGCGYLSPIHTLHRVIIKVEKGEPIEESPIEGIDIKADLRSAGISISDFSRCLKFLRARLMVPTGSDHKEMQPEIELVIKQAKSSFVMCETLLSHYFKIQALRDAENKVFMDLEELIEAVKAAFHIIPGFEVSTDKQNRMWLIHTQSSALFRDIRSRILLAPIYIGEGQVKLSHLLEWPKNITNPTLTNTIIYISDCIFSTNCKRFCGELAKNGIVALTITSKELIEFAISDDPVAIIEGKLLETA